MSIPRDLDIPLLLVAPRPAASCTADVRVLAGTAADGRGDSTEKAFAKAYLLFRPKRGGRSRWVAIDFDTQ
jgi:hypothetical protein